jgi:hypothetical protein
VTIQKDGRFIMTGYRRGEKVRCGRDATGYKLFARSGVDCARKGYGWRQILRTYYGAGISLVGDGAAAAPTDAPAPPETSVAPPPETSVVPPSTPTTSPPDAGAVGDTPGAVVPTAASPTGEVGGAQSGGLADSVFDHEQRLLLLWLASNSIV